MKRGLAWIAIVTGAAFGQTQPRLQNAKLETRAISGSPGSSLESTYRGIANGQTSPAWIGWAVPQLPGERNMCCYNTINGVMSQGCGLEPSNGNITFGANGGPGTVHLEGATEFFVFLRVEDKKLSKIRSFSIECNIDAGGLPVYWLTGVNAAQSVGLLASMVPATDSRDDRRITDGAISAIAMTRDPAADGALDRLTAPSLPEETRRQAVFWLGNARGRHGMESVLRVLHSDPSERVREHAVFALTQSKEADAIPAVVKVAHDDTDARVRGQALFWLAQTASKQISEAAIRQAIDQDPEAQVKRRAVESLMQIKNGDGVPLLIEIARNNKNPAIRKEAMRLLGNSKDPRALKFFEEVLAVR